MILGWENTLAEGMATQSSILAWRIPMNTRSWQATVHGVAKSQRVLTLLSTNTHTSLSIFIVFFLIGRNVLFILQMLGLCLQ